MRVCVYVCLSACVQLKESMDEEGDSKDDEYFAVVDDEEDGDTGGDNASIPYSSSIPTSSAPASRSASVPPPGVASGPVSDEET